MNTKALGRIAEITGGRRLGPGDAPFNGPRAPDYRDISPWLSIVALMLFFGELTSGTLRSLGRRPGWLRMGARPVKGSRAA